MNERTCTVEKARLSDVEAIQRIINPFADQGLMLHRTREHIEENIRDFHVYRENGEVMGCAALHVLGENLSEIRAVAIPKHRHGQGIGRRLVQSCLDEAQYLRIPKVFLLTYRQEIFGRFGFESVDIMTIPEKVLGECKDCPKGPPSNCEEIAMVRQ